MQGPDSQAAPGLLPGWGRWPWAGPGAEAGMQGALGKACWGGA